MAKAKSNNDTKDELYELLQPHIARKEMYFMRIQSLYDLSKQVLNNPELVDNFISRLADINIWRDSYEGVVHKIISLNKQYNPEYSSSFKEIESFDSLYYSIQSIASKLPNLNKSSVKSENKASIINAKPRLPKIEIFHFDSSLENWPTFRDTFTSLIHSNSDIADIEKYYYLLSSISGPALSIVKSMPITADNYSIVWNALYKRYENKRALATAYLDKLFNFKPLQSETFNGLNSFLQVFQDSVKALQLLNIQDLSSFILFYIALRNLDPTSRRAFEQSIHQHESIPTFYDLILFIENHVRVLEMSDGSKATCTKQVKVNSPYIKPKKATLTSPAVFHKNSNNSYYSNYVGKECLYCKNKAHSIYRCPEYIELSPAQRLDAVAKLKLCVNCLRTNHSVNSCPSKIQCTVCKKSHHHTLHLDSSNLSNNAVTLTCSAESTVLLGTAIIHVADCWGQYHTVRAVIDSGAMTGYITQDCALRLGLSRRKCNFQSIGLGGNRVQDFGLTTCTVKPRNCDSPTLTTDTVIVSKITGNLPTLTLSNKVIQHFQNYNLADPSFYKPGPIDILLAGDLFPYIYDGDRILPHQSGMPVALNSIFGYVIAGQTVLSQHSNQSPAVIQTEDNSVNTYCSISMSLDQIMDKFWDIENISTEVPQNPDDILAEHLFAEQHRRDATGRYVVKYPMRPALELGDSRQIAIRRFLNLEHKLEREQELKLEYHKFMKEYESLGHMSCLGSIQDVDSNYIIPHFCIVKPTSTTTQHRVVFDASCKTSNGNSLNSLVLPGPKLQADLNRLIVNFRLREISLSADICKMFRQIIIEEDQRPFQHILWRSSVNDPIQVYELNTVTYGISSSPYLAIKVLQTLADDEVQKFPYAAEILKSGFFVDNLLWSEDTVEEAIKLQNDLIALLKLGGFLLRKWSSNSLQVLENVPDDHREIPITFDDDRSLSVNVLGLQWSPTSDSFSFSALPPNPVVTKRTILSQIGRQFDPLGFVAPCVFLAKCLMQKLWSQQLGWDDSLPVDLKHQWQSYANELPLLAQLKHDRHVVIKQHSSCQVIGFCDASSKGIAAAVYLRTQNKSAVKVSLLIAKSKVAPLKVVTIPRLELMASHLLSKLVTYVYSILQNKLEINDTLLFTDSSVVLNWLNTPSFTLKTFVGTRVSKIVNAVPSSCWYHVSGASNPADICSRGALPSILLETPEWLNGPEWLYADISSWPVKSISEFKDVNPPELKPVTHTLVVSESPDSDLIYDLTERYSSYSKLLNVVARIHLFLSNLKHRSQPSKWRSLSISDIRKAHDLIIKSVQRQHFSQDIVSLSKGDQCSGSLRKLNPFLDTNNFLRVGGRLSQADLSFNKKHPLLLPKRCNFTEILIDHYHRIYLHVGPRTLQSLLTQKYWLISARSIIRSRTTKCISCFKVSPVSKQPFMGELPKFRSENIHPFHTVGVDIGGPFFIKESTRKNARITKAYLCLFVCCATRAVHLEVVSSLSTECFLACFDRFTARRGLCRSIISDNGTNFVSAGKHIAEVSQFLRSNSTELSNGFISRNVEWMFNPPAGSHFGGIYESAIKAAKLHLKRTVGSKALTFEELTTIFSRAEAVLNSRPLCALSSDPSEFDVLTPSHFLVGRELLSVPEYDLCDVSPNQLNRWQHVQQVSQAFWNKWKRDYLHLLQQRQKWFNKCQNLKVGDLVLINSNTPPLQWSRARVTKLHPGPDGTVRVVSVRTQNSEFTRPVVKLSPLPLEEETQ